MDSAEAQPAQTYRQTINASRPLASNEREQYILHHCDLIRYTARRLKYRLPSYISVEDLFSAGVIGLMDAIDKFNPNQKVQFRTYARIRIKGAMLDEIRSMDWVPRSLRQKSAKLAKACEELEEQLERSPTEEEIAAALEISLDSYSQLINDLKGISFSPIEIENALGEQRLDQLREPLEPFQVIYREQLCAKLAEAIRQLPRQEQLVLSLYYYEDLTMKEIGSMLGYTEARISQLHTKAVLSLRRRLTRVLKREDLPETV